MNHYKIGEIISIVENGKRINGVISSFTLDSITYGSTIVEKKYFIHWNDGRITKESTGQFYDTKTTSIKDILV